MPMSRKDFFELADLLGKNADSLGNFEELLELMSDFCAARNPQFDREKFKGRCREIKAKAEGA